MSDNLDLWESVCSTDPKYVKKVKQRGGYSSISPQYQIMKATETFGPYGLGWGFDSIDIDTGLIETTGLAIVKAVFFYVANGSRATFPINNAWPAKQGERYDPDFMKKAETNTMSKALSKLGFSADVFMGEFDDAGYVEEQAKQSLQDMKIKQDEEKAKAARVSMSEAESACTEMKNAKTMTELEGVYKSAFRKAVRVNDVAVIKMINDTKESVKLQLEEGQSND
jgi:Mor family transcriptional regulator